MLMLRDHEKYGDTYAQWGELVYTVITRDTSNIRELLSGQFEGNVTQAVVFKRKLMFVQPLKLVVAGMGASDHYSATESLRRMVRPGKHRGSYCLL